MAVMRIPAFVGRETELDAMSSLLAEAASGRARCVVIQGPSGVGKTRLVQQFVAEARDRGASVLAGHCREGAATPYLVWHGPLRQLARRWRGDPRLVHVERLRGRSDGEMSVLPPEHAAALMYSTVADLIIEAAMPDPVVVVIEDLHWADTASLQLLGHVAAAVSDAALNDAAAVLLVVTCREAPSGDVESALEDLDHEGISTVVELGGLEEPSLGLLVRDVTGVEPSPGLLSSLVRDASGNPFAVQSVLNRGMGSFVAERDGILDATGEITLGPARVTSEISMMLAALSADTRAVLTAAAFLGDGPVDEWADVVSTDRAAFEAAMADALRVGAVAVHDGVVSFTHPEIRHVLFAGPHGDERTVLHARVAAGLASRIDTPAPSDVQRIAGHLLLAGDHEPALSARWLVPAGDAAFQQAAWGEAARMYTRAIDHLDRATSPSLQARNALALYRAHDLESAFQAAQSAIEAARAVVDLEAWALAAEVAVRVCIGHPDAAKPVHGIVDDFLEAARDGDSSTKARMLALNSEALFVEGDTRAGMTAASDALHLAGDDPELSVPVRFAVGLQAMAKLDLDDARRFFQVSRDQARAVGDTWRAGWGGGRLPLVEMLSGDLTAAEVAYESAQDLARGNRDWSEVALAGAVGTAVAVCTGRFSDAERRGSVAAAAYVRSKYAYCPPLLFPALAACRTLRGDVAGAMEAVDEWDYVGGWAGEPLRATIRALNGELSGDGVRTRVVRGASNLFELDMACLTAEAADAAGDSEALAASAPGLCELWDRGVVWTPGWPLFIPRLALAALRRSGDGAGAAARETAALGLARRSGARPEVARLLLDRAISTDDETDRLSAARESVALFDLLGMFPYLERATGMLEDLSGTSEGSGRTRMILCTDIVDSTGMNASVGDAAWLDILRDHNSLVRRCLRRHGGVEFKHTGDGFLAWFDDAADAVSCSMEMQSELMRRNLGKPGHELYVRAGVTVGEPLWEGTDLFGMAVNAAARVCAGAEGGEVLVSADVADRAGEGATFGPARNLDLKGIPYPVSVRQAITVAAG